MGEGGGVQQRSLTFYTASPLHYPTAQVSSKFLLELETDTGTVRLVILNRSVLHTLKISHDLEADQQNLLV